MDLSLCYSLLEVVYMVRPILSYDINTLEFFNIKNYKLFFKTLKIKINTLYFIEYYIKPK